MAEEDCASAPTNIAAKASRRNWVVAENAHRREDGSAKTSPQASGAARGNRSEISRVNLGMRFVLNYRIDSYTLIGGIECLRLKFRWFLQTATSVTCRLEHFCRKNSNEESGNLAKAWLKLPSRSENNWMD